MTGLAFVMAWFNVKEEIIRIVLGVLGLVIVIKAITKLTGNEGGIVDQVIDESMEKSEGI